MSKILAFIAAMLLTVHTAYSDTTNTELYKKAALSAMIISTWTTIGINEGQKWKQNTTGNIDLFWKDDYHLYRGFTGVTVAGLPLVAMSLNNKDMRDNLKLAVISNLMGWAIYECMVVSVQGNSIFQEKGNMELLGIGVPMPRPALSLAMAAISSIAIQYSF